MTTKQFPIEKIFGSRTRVKVISLFTTGINRPYYVREIARAVNERLNAVRRELEILSKIGMLSSYDNKRRKYYVLNQDFVLLKELTSIMIKTGPKVEDSLFKNIQKLGDVHFACASGIFTNAENSPTDFLIIGNIDERKLNFFAKRIEHQIGNEITYTPITLNEYRYRRNFNDMFLRQIFSGPYTVIVNKLESDIRPEPTTEQQTAPA
jgi:predicted transcriptional regulator